MKNQGTLYQELLELSKEIEITYGKDGLSSTKATGEALKTQIETVLGQYIQLEQKVSLKEDDIQESMFLLMLCHIQLLKQGVHLVYPQDLRNNAALSINDIEQNLYGLVSYLESLLPVEETWSLMARSNLREVLSAVFNTAQGFSLKWNVDEKETEKLVLNTFGSCEALPYFKFILAKMDVGSVDACQPWLAMLIEKRKLWWDGNLSSFSEADHSLVPVAEWKSISGEKDFIQSLSEKNQALSSGEAVSLNHIEELESTVLSKIPAKRGDILSHSLSVRGKSLGLSGISVLSPEDWERILETAAANKELHNKRHLLLQESSKKFSESFQEKDDIREFMGEQEENLLCTPIKQEIITILEAGTSDNDNWTSSVEKVEGLAELYGAFCDFTCHTQVFAEDGFHFNKERQAGFSQGLSCASKDGVVNIEAVFQDALEQVLYAFSKDSKEPKEHSVFLPESVSLWKDFYWKSYLPQSETDMIGFFSQSLYPFKLKISKEWKSIYFTVGSLPYARFMLSCKNMIHLALSRGDTSTKGFFRVEFSTEKLYGAKYFTMSFEFSTVEDSGKSAKKEQEVTEIPAEFRNVSDFFLDFGKKYHNKESLTGNKKDTFYQWKQKDKVYHGKFFLDENLFQIGEDV